MAAPGLRTGLHKEEAGVPDNDGDVGNHGESGDAESETGVTAVDIPEYQGRKQHSHDLEYHEYGLPDDPQQERVTFASQPQLYQVVCQHRIGDVQQDQQNQQVLQLNPASRFSITGDPAAVKLEGWVATTLVGMKQVDTRLHLTIDWAT